MAEGRLAEQEHRTNDAARSDVDSIRLGPEAFRGGLLIDHLVGLAGETMGGTGLARMVPALNGQECRAIIGPLGAIASKREPLEDKLQVERSWSRQAGGLKDGIGWIISFRTLNSSRKMVTQTYVPRNLQGAEVRSGAWRSSKLEATKHLSRGAFSIGCI